MPGELGGQGSEGQQACSQPNLAYQGCQAFQLAFQHCGFPAGAASGSARFRWSAEWQYMQSVSQQANSTGAEASSVSRQYIWHSHIVNTQHGCQLLGSCSNFPCSLMDRGMPVLPAMLYIMLSMPISECEVAGLLTGNLQLAMQGTCIHLGLSCCRHVVVIQTKCSMRGGAC